MKTLLLLLIAVMLFCSPALAGESHYPRVEVDPVALWAHQSILDNYHLIGTGRVIDLKIERFGIFVTRESKDGDGLFGQPFKTWTEVYEVVPLRDFYDPCNIWSIKLVNIVADPWETPELFWDFYHQCHAE